MTCNQDYISIYKRPLNRIDRWYLGIIERFNGTEHSLDWPDGLIISIGFIAENNLYIFTPYDFIIYSLDSFSKINSWLLSNNDNHHLEYNHFQCGTVHDKYIYHIFLTNKSYWILSIFDLETINHLYDYNLTNTFPNVKRFIYIYIINKTICFLVEMDGLKYGVIFCSNNNNNNNQLKLEIKILIPLSYADNPLTICSIYIHHIENYIFFINDPSAKVIHILTNEKYLQSYSIIAYTLCYIEENHELILTSNDGIYSININEQQNFFSKFH